MEGGQRQPAGWMPNWAVARHAEFRLLALGCAPIPCPCPPFPAECGISSLPAGPYLHGLVELFIDGNAFLPRREPIPPSALASAAQLTSLTVSLDASKEEMEEQWPQVQVRLRRLPFGLTCWFAALRQLIHAQPMYLQAALLQLSKLRVS